MNPKITISNDEKMNTAKSGVSNLGKKKQNIKTEGEKIMNEKSIVSIMVGGLVICGVAGFLSTTTVPANSVGIKYSKFTGTSEETLPEGVHFKIPFVERVEIIDTKVQERTDKEVSVQTKDAQWVNMVVNVKYAVSKEKKLRATIKQMEKALC